MKQLLLLLPLLPTVVHCQIVEHMWNLYYDGFISSAIYSFEYSYYRYPSTVKELKKFVQNYFFEQYFDDYANGDYHLCEDSVYCWIDSMTIKSVQGYCFFSFCNGTSTFYIEKNRCQMRNDFRGIGQIAEPSFLDQMNFPIFDEDYDIIREKYKDIFIRPLNKMLNEKYLTSDYQNQAFILHYENDTIQSFCDDCMCLVELEVKKKMQEELRTFIKICPNVHAINFLIILPIKKCKE